MTSTSATRPGTGDRVGKAVWDAAWARRAPAAAATAPGTVFEPGAPGVRGHGARRYHDSIRERLASRHTTGMSLLEVGCARSALLPYFARSLGYRVHGLDYSELGCEQARAALARAGVRGEVTCADLFAPPASLLGRFDVVTSFGVAEHFDDTAGCIRALARMVRPGGLVLTAVPNMAGVLGTLQRALDRKVYDMHVPLDREALAAAHRDAGLAAVSCDYIMFASSGVLNIDQLPPSASARAKRALVLRPLHALSLGIWWIEEALAPFPPNRWSSPYLICTGRR